MKCLKMLILTNVILMLVQRVLHINVSTFQCFPIQADICCTIAAIIMRA